MKLLFDQNISFRLIKEINKTFLLATSVKTLGLTDATDIEIWKYAQQKNFAIVTFDSDFLDLSTLYGSPPKIILLKTGNMTTSDLATFLVKMKDVINDFLKSKEMEFLLLSQMDIKE